ncbi:MAG: restriction endonuclease subunit S [Spirochaetales bacterium]|nr:restriction endonuclease subunit S [Spirochaetales bacterium]
MKFLFNNFDILAESPEGIKKLREMILQFAVQGKLVPQDPNDEHVSVLLKRIKSEKEQLVKDSKIKKQKELEPIQQDEIPYEIPHKWKWCRIRSISHDWGQKKPDSDFTYIDVTSINKEKGIIGENTQLLDENSAPSRARKIVKEGTVIYSTVRPYLLNIAIIGKEYLPEPIVSTAFAIVHPLGKIQNRYLYYYFRSIPFINYVESKMIGMAYPAINDTNFFKGLIPIPPLSEQKRILAKVNSLMALCDDLEKQQQEKAIKKLTLNKASLHTLYNSTTKQDFNKNWNHITNNFNLLYSTPENVKELKQTVLQLAVQGKLVPQDPRDEPASVLLAKIRVEKERLVKEGKIKNQKPLETIKADEIPFELPKGWELSRLQEAIDVRDGTHDSPKDAIGKDTYPIVTSKNFYNGTIKFDEARQISAEDHNNISKRSFVEPYDILFSMIGGNLGNQVMVTDDRPFSIKNVALFKYYNRNLTSPFFIKKFMEHLALDLQSKAAGGAQPFVSLGFLRKLIIAIPPIKEQNRIVDKVDSLMDLCDRLSLNLKNKEIINGKMLNSILNKVVS